VMGGGPGAPGSFELSDGRQANPKQLLQHEPTTRVDTALPGGAGYGDPFERDPQAVLNDVLNGYVSLEGAARDYGVVVVSTQRPDELIRLPKHLSIDEQATVRLGQTSAAGRPPAVELDDRLGVEGDGAGVRRRAARAVMCAKHRTRPVGLHCLA
jgi:hypothetical protein